MATGSTANYSFPYPQQTDPVDVAGDVQALADSIDLGLKEIIEDKSAALFTNASVSNGFTLPIYDDANSKMILTLDQNLSTSGKPSFAALSVTASAGLTVSASSSSTLVNIIQTGSGNALLIQDSASVDSTPFVIDSEGRVGIGLPSPTALLEIKDNANSANLLFGGSGSSDVMKIGTPSGDSLAIYTNGSEVIRIDTSGRVGIGLTNPSTALEINGETKTSSLNVSGTTTTSLLNISSTTLTLNSTVTGSASSDAYIKIERGTDPDVFIKWDETLDVWQFTNDGTIYQNIGAGDDSLSDILMFAGM